jgi:hypothetical protein
MAVSATERSIIPQVILRSDVHGEPIKAACRQQKAHMGMASDRDAAFGGPMAGKRPTASGIGR